MKSIFLFLSLILLSANGFAAEEHACAEVYYIMEDPFNPNPFKVTFHMYPRKHTSSGTIAVDDLDKLARVVSPALLNVKGPAGLSIWPGTLIQKELLYKAFDYASRKALICFFRDTASDSNKPRVTLSNQSWSL